jgi:hypothetical protein
VEENSLPPVPKSDRIEILASTLRTIGDIGGILQKDLELYHTVTEAYRKLPPAAVG